MIGVYAIRNTQNSKMYIGESIDIEKRWKSHYVYTMKIINWVKQFI